MKSLIPIGVCALALLGGVAAGRATSSGRETPTAEADAPCGGANVDARGASNARHRPPGSVAIAAARASLRQPTPGLSPWQRLVADQPELSMRVKLAIQDEMSDMRWVEVVHACSRTLEPLASSTRFTATIVASHGALTVTNWSGRVLDGPEISDEVLACVIQGLPTGVLDLGRPWPGADGTLELEFDLSLAGTGSERPDR